MTTEELIELSASARKRKAASFIATHKREFEEAKEQATAPLKERIVELEGLLANAVENGDRLAEELAKSEAALADSKAHVESLQSQLKVFEAQIAEAAKAAPAKAAKKRGK